MAEILPLDAPLPTREDLLALAGFLDAFERPGFQAGSFVPEEGVIPYIVAAPEVDAFHRALYERGFVRDFDWIGWRKEESGTWDAARIAAADLLTLCKLITAIARWSRFTEGGFESMVADGTFPHILRRLRALVEHHA